MAFTGRRATVRRWSVFRLASPRVSGYSHESDGTVHVVGEDNRLRLIRREPAGADIVEQVGIGQGAIFGRL